MTPFKITFPIVRKVFSQLISAELVSVQPMAMPKGILNFLEVVYSRTRTRCTSQAELNKLFKICWKFDEMFPVGSIVHLDVNKVLSMSESVPQTLVVKSEFFVLSNLSSVGFLCNESKDDSEFYYVDDLVEYKAIIEELGNELK